MANLEAQRIRRSSASAADSCCQFVFGLAGRFAAQLGNETMSDLSESLGAPDLDLSTQTCADARESLDGPAHYKSFLLTISRNRV